MQLTNPLVVLLLAALPAAVNASIAIGNQIRAGGDHYNVAWTEGVDACNNDVAIAPESENMCGSENTFQVDGNEYYLSDCLDPDTGYAQKPARLMHGDGTYFGTCGEAYYHIDCKGTTHDVIKRYICG